MRRKPTRVRHHRRKTRKGTTGVSEHMRYSEEDKMFIARETYKALRKNPEFVKHLRQKSVETPMIAWGEIFKYMKRTQMRYPTVISMSDEDLTEISGVIYNMFLKDFDYERIGGAYR